MSTAMYDAREALIPGSVYDRSSTGIYTETFLVRSVKMVEIILTLFCVSFQPAVRQTCTFKLTTRLE